MHATLTFTRPADVVADEDRPGLLRALHAADDDAGEVHVCPVVDLSQPTSVEPGLHAAGFETVDLSNNSVLQSALAEVGRADELTATTGAAIRESLDGASFELGSGASLQVVQVVDDGLFHRRSGPNRLNVNPGGIQGANNHGGAEYVHGDQDVFGTPLRQLMDGAAPTMFRHVTPDGRNDEAGLMLVNLWVPVHAPVQPLALMDRRTLDAPRHQLRYGLPVDGFLDRDDEESVNDIWNFLHHADQQWYLHSDMGPNRGYLFDTLGTGHGAAVLPGEDALEEMYLLLQQTCEAHENAKPEAAEASAATKPRLRPPAEATPTIHKAWQEMAKLQDRAANEVTDQWCSEAKAAMSNVIRRSIEIRLVAAVSN